MMGFPSSNLSTAQSVAEWLQWKNANCQPNFWKVCVQPKALVSVYFLHTVCVFNYMITVDGRFPYIA